MIGLATKLENLFVYKFFFCWKNQLKLMASKKLLTDLTSAQTFKVCCKAVGRKGVNHWLNKLMNNKGICRAAPGFARVS